LARAVRIGSGGLMLAGAAAVACRATTEPEGRCQPVMEGGSAGCAVLAGRVTDAAGRPLAGALLRVAVPAGRGSGTEFGTTVGQADAAGAYRLWLTRYGTPSAPPAADTISVWIRASAPQDGGADQADSALVVLEVRPVGARPAVVTAPTLRVPPD
jgi:hypothetical protein